MSKHRAALLAAVTLTAIAAAPAEARVFRRVGRLAAAETFRTVGGRLAYEADVTINGGNGRLTVAGFSAGMPDVIRQLRHTFNTPDLPMGSSGVIQATMRYDGDVTRLMVFHLGTASKTIAIAIEQSEDEYDTSKRPPERHLQKDMPALPASTPRFFIRDHEALMSLAVADTQASKRTAVAYFETALTRDGWQAAVPESPGTQMRVFLRGHEVCCVYVAPGSSLASQNTIAVLHKQQRVE